MKTLIILFCILSFYNAWAQEVGVKLNTNQQSENTTIEIRKGDKASNTKKRYEITEGEDSISGDPEVLLKNAQNNWKKACSEWKKEIREGNSEHKVVSISCGRMVCTKEGVESKCNSSGTYKIRVPVEE